jgi:hypothetical protein
VEEEPDKVVSTTRGVGNDKKDIAYNCSSVESRILIERQV